MRQRLRIVRPGAAVAGAVPWWRARWLVITGAVLWWLLTYLFWLAVAVVAVAGVLIGALLWAVGVMAHFAGESR
jgi:uncharacterized membrane protein